MDSPCPLRRCSDQGCTRGHSNCRHTHFSCGSGVGAVGVSWGVLGLPLAPRHVLCLRDMSLDPVFIGLNQLYAEWGLFIFHYWESWAETEVGVVRVHTAASLETSGRPVSGLPMEMWSPVAHGRLACPPTGPPERTSDFSAVTGSVMFGRKHLQPSSMQMFCFLLLAVLRVSSGSVLVGWGPRHARDQTSVLCPISPCRRLAECSL